MKLKSWLPIVVAFIAPLVLVYTWWGGFRAVHITEAERGPYVYAYLMHSGDYANIPATQDKVRNTFTAQGITPGLPINVLLDDPRKVGRAQLRAQVGFMVPASQPIQAPLVRAVIAQRPVWVASVHAAALLAPGKAYQALYDFMAERQRDIRMPTVEIYESPPVLYRVGTLSVEMAR